MSGECDLCGNCGHTETSCQRSRTDRNERLAAMIETLIGIELLEYHDMNFLSGDNKRRNETKRAILHECLLMTGGRTDMSSI